MEVILLTGKNTNIKELYNTYGKIYGNSAIIKSH